jgi:hypothetical protein
MCLLGGFSDRIIECEFRTDAWNLQAAAWLGLGNSPETSDASPSSRRQRPTLTAI